MTITLTPDVGANNANSYVSVAEADAYFDARLFSDAWTAADANVENKKRALIGATSRLDQCFFAGVRATSTQALQWPRIDTDDDCLLADMNITATMIPDIIKKAVYETAFDYFTRKADPAATNKLAQFSSLTVPGGLSMTMRAGPKGNDELRDVALRLIAPVINSGVTYMERT